MAKYLITISTGVVTGIIATLLGKSVGAMFEWKNEFIQEVLDAPGEHRIWIAFLWHAAYSSILVTFAVALVSTFAQQAVVALHVRNESQTDLALA